MNDAPDFIQDVGDQITLVDTGLLGDGVVACYLVESEGEYAVIETGNYLTAARIMEALETQSASLEQVKYVIPTHIHLDHVGGASNLLEQMPGAQLILHPSGVKHMVNPEKLVQGAMQVYGYERFHAMYGDIKPIAEHRIIPAEDQDSFRIGSRELLIRHTPGHAWHHFCVWDAQSRSWFTGDTFGICYDACKTDTGFLHIPTTTPTQFNAEALIDSIQMMIAMNPKQMLLTHFGAIDVKPDMAENLVQQIRDYVDITLDQGASLEDHRGLKSQLMDYSQKLVRNRGIALEPSQVELLLDMDLELNSQGLFYWYQKQV